MCLQLLLSSLHGHIANKKIKMETRDETPKKVNSTKLTKAKKQKESNTQQLVDDIIVLTQETETESNCSS